MNEVEIKRWYQDDCVVGRLTFGEFECFTLELPDKQNQVNISCIPEGMYWAKKRFSPSKQEYVVEYQNVPNRTYIQIHRGNFTRQLLGCQAVGDGIKWIDHDAILDVTNSDRTFKRLMDALPNERFRIHVYKG